MESSCRPEYELTRQLQPLSHPTSDPAFLPATLYKGSEEQHVRNLLEGRIRVGTLHSYRQIESRTPGIRDPGEGYRQIDIPSYQADEVPYGTLPYPLASMGFMGRDTVASFDFRRGTYDDHCYDMYVVCTSLSIRGGQTLYPAGVRILHPLRFARAIDRRLRESGLVDQPFGAAPCVYVSKVQDFRRLNALPLVFQKDPVHATQEEFRFAWWPRASPPSFQDFEILELAELVERAW